MFANLLRDYLMDQQLQNAFDMYDINNGLLNYYNLLYKFYILENYKFCIITIKKQ